MEATKQPQTQPIEQEKPKKKPSPRRLQRVSPKWVKRASLTILSRKINQILDKGKLGDITKDDVEILLKAIEAARRLEKDSHDSPDTYKLDPV